MRGYLISGIGADFAELGSVLFTGTFLAGQEATVCFAVWLCI